MQNLNTVASKPIATLSDYFSEPAISEQLDWACDDSNLIDEMRERIELASMAKGWDEQKQQLDYHIGEMRCLIDTMERLVKKSPEWPVTVDAMKNYALAIGKADECLMSIMTAAKQALAEEYIDETEEFHMIAVPAS